jgi:2-polyprenyl-6-methoxyphenol hydroxylase-like FAD-dependent oxidoreductase
LVRQALLESAPVKILEEYEVTDLHFDSRRQAVVGVHARRRGRDLPSDESHELKLDADLVVDASGRDSHILRWLEAGGFPLPKETVLDPSLGYASCFYRPDQNTERTWHGMAHCLTKNRLFQLFGEVNVIFRGNSLEDLFFLPKKAFFKQQYVHDSLVSFTRRPGNHIHQRDA